MAQESPAAADPADSGSAAGPTAEQPVRRVERDGVGYTLLGTAHVSRASAEAGAKAETSKEQAMALGEMANACGGCHESLSKGPILGEPPAPGEIEGLRFHMARHAWVNDRMWAALIEPNGDNWTRSLRVLGPEAVSPEELEDWGQLEGATEQGHAVASDEVDEDIAVHITHIRPDSPVPDDRIALPCTECRRSPRPPRSDRRTLVLRQPVGPCPGGRSRDRRHQVRKVGAVDKASRRDHIPPGARRRP